MPQEDAAKSGNIRLKPAQERVLAALAAADEVELTRARYEQLAGVSRSQAAYDLAELVGAGILQRTGNGRATRYRVRPDEPAAQRRWTEERIWGELVEFCAGRQTWPSAREFKDAGRGDLYVAASRYGGVARWARALGVAQVARSSPPRVSLERRPPRLRARLAWAGAGALAAIVLAGAGAAGLGLLHRPAAAPHAAAPSFVGGVADEGLHPFLAPALPAHKPATRHVARSTARRQAVVRTGRPAPTPRHVAAATSSIAQAASVLAPPTKSWLSSASASAAPSGGPVPLAAPMGAVGPSPLKAPGP